MISFGRTKNDLLVNKQMQHTKNSKSKGTLILGVGSTTFFLE